MKKLFLIFFIVFFISVVSSGIYFANLKAAKAKKQTFFSPLANSISRVKQEIVHALRPSLQTLVANSLSKKDGQYAIVYKNLTTGQGIMLNENTIFASASLYKLWVMAITFEQLTQEKLRENQVITGNVEKINDLMEIATESAVLKNGSLSMTVGEALEKMITISDNYAALTLVNTLGQKTIVDFLKKHEFFNSAYVSPPKTTALDIAKFYEKLYKNQLGDAKATRQMIDLLLRQQINDRLPRLLPKDIAVAHKTGELDGFKHDAGIIYSPNADYILVVLSNTKNPSTAVDTQAKLSLTIYDYINK